MTKTQGSDIAIKALNAGLGLAGFGLMGFGYVTGNGLQGLGFVLILTSIMSYVGIHFAIQQQQGRAEPVQKLRSVASNTSERFTAAS